MVNYVAFKVVGPLGWFQQLAKQINYIIFSWKYHYKISPANKLDKKFYFHT